MHGYKPAYKIGGPVISVSALAETLIEKGHEVTVFTTNCNLDEDLNVPVNRPQNIDGVKVWFFRRLELLQKLLPFSGYFSKSMGFLYAPEMYKKLVEILPDMDLVHTHLPFIYPTYIAGKAAKEFNKPLFYHQRGVFDPARLNFRSLKKKIYLTLIEKPLLNYATTLIGLTKAEENSFKMLCPNSTCRIIPNGINVDQYRIKANSILPFAFAPSDTVVLFMGRLHPIKGADRIIEAFIRVSNEHQNAFLVMAGPDEFKIEDSFKEKVKNAGLNSRILFPGMLEGEDKLNLLARADLFCLPSDAEGFSMAVLEAMASETAVMLSPGCHFPEVEKNNCGIVVENDVDQIALSLSFLIKDKNRLTAMGKNAHSFVAKNYTWDKISDEMIEVYHEGIERFSKSRKHCK